MKINLNDCAIKDRKIAKNGDLKIVLLCKETDYSPEDYKAIDNAFRSEEAVDATLEDGKDSTPPMMVDSMTGEINE